MTAAVAVVVATRDRGRQIEPLLASLAALTDDDYELVIVDQTVASETSDAIAPYLTDERWRYLRSGERGLSRARNLAIAHTTAPIVAITDDDCRVPPEWLSAMRRPFDDPSVGMVFCSVTPVATDRPGHTPHIVFDRTETLTTVHDAWRAARHELPLGAGMAIRRAAYDAVGGFDVELGAGARFGATEDSDLSWRMLRDGWRTVHLASVAVAHDGFRDLDEFRQLVRRDLHGVGGAFGKWVRVPEWRLRLGAARFFASWLVRFGLTQPLGQVLHGERPRGFRRPMFLIGGLRDGLRVPLDAHFRFDPQGDDDGSSALR